MGYEEVFNRIVGIYEDKVKTHLRSNPEELKKAVAEIRDLIGYMEKHPEIMEEDNPGPNTLSVARNLERKLETATEVPWFDVGRLEAQIKKLKSAVESGNKD